MPVENPGGTDTGGDDFLQELGLDEPGTPDTSSVDRIVQEPSPQGTPSGPFKFAGREYKDLTAAEKAYKSLQSEFGTRSGRLKQLEALWRNSTLNPLVRQAAAQDPEMAAALVKLGIVKSQSELEAVGERDEQPQEGARTMETLAEEVETLKARFTMERELVSLESEMKRPLTDEEKDAVFKVGERMGWQGTMRDWWMLSSGYQKILTARQKEAVENATKKAGGNRPRPTPGGLPGQKLDLKKPVSEMNPTEYREALRAEMLETGMAD